MSHDLDTAAATLAAEGLSDEERAVLLPEIDPRKRQALLKQSGKTEEEWGRLSMAELADPRVQSARRNLYLSVEAMASRVRQLGLAFSGQMFHDQRMEIARAWNEAVAHTQTLLRYCEWCAAPVVNRHRESRFCREKCTQAAKDAKRGPRRALARKLRGHGSE